jgi:hypothetical protein
MVFLASVILAGFVSAHPMHISFTSVEFNDEKKTVTVSHKFYTNDFSLLFYHVYERIIEPQQDTLFTKAEIDLISQYMRERFMLLTDNDTIALEFIAKEQDGEFIWLSYRGDLLNTGIKSLVIDNLLMLDLFEDQTNLVIIARGSKENGFSFDYMNRRSVLNMEE